MNNASKAIAVSVLTLGALASSTAAASAKVPPEPAWTYTSAAPAEVQQVQVDDTVTEGIQAGASALAGAAVMFGGLWVYRRRYSPAVTA